MVFGGLTAAQNNGADSMRKTLTFALIISIFGLSTLPLAAQPRIELPSFLNIAINALEDIWIVITNSSLETDITNSSLETEPDEAQGNETPSQNEPPQNPQNEEPQNELGGTYDPYG